MILYLQGDSDIIFADLDHDGDGKINFEDFSFGFRDFLTPGSRRGSLQLGLAQGPGSGLGGGGRVVLFLKCKVACKRFQQGEGASRP